LVERKKISWKGEGQRRNVPEKKVREKSLPGMVKLRRGGLSQEGFLAV